MDGTTIIYDERSKQEIQKLINFCSEIIIKDPDEVEKNETLESNARGYRLISACLKSDTLDQYLNIDQHLGYLTSYFDGIRYYKVSEVPERYRDILLDYERWLLYKQYYEEGDSNPYYQNIYNKYIKDFERRAKNFDSFLEMAELPFFVSARLAKDFSLLYTPLGYDIDLNRFKKCYGYVQNYFLTACYNDAYEITNENYNKLCQVIIILMVIERYLNARLENIDDIDFFDEYSIRNLFLSYGLDYFFDMPLKYQKRILKNINFLIKNKGSNKDLINVLSIFGFKNVKIMKYFICKEYQKDASGNLSDKDAKLFFYGVDVETEHLEKALQDKYTTVTDYETFTRDDKWWQMSPEEYQELIVEPFNQVYTKYISINFYNNLYESGAKFSTFINLVYYIWSRYTELKKDPENELNHLFFFDNKLSNQRIYLLDAIVAMYLLLQKKYDVPDVICENPENIVKVIGFNFDFLSNNIKTYTTKYLKKINNPDLTQEELDKIEKDYNEVLTRHKVEKHIAIINTICSNVLDRKLFKNDFLSLCNKHNIEGTELLGMLLILADTTLPSEEPTLSLFYYTTSDDPNKEILSNIYDYLVLIAKNANTSAINKTKYETVITWFDIKTEYNFYKDKFLFDDPLQFNKTDKFNFEFFDFNSFIDSYNYTSLFKNNYNVKEKLENLIVHERKDYRRFRYLKSMYTKMFSTDYRYNLFKGYNKFEDYLRDKDPELYKFIEKVDLIAHSNDSDALDQTAYDAGIMEICSAVDGFLASEEFDFLVEQNPILLEYIENLVYQLVYFVKSYTVHLKNMDSIIVFDDIYPNLFVLFDIVENWQDRQTLLPDLLALNEKLYYINQLPVGVDDLFIGKLRDLIFIHTIIRMHEKLGLGKDDVELISKFSYAELYELLDTKLEYKNILPLLDKYFVYDLKDVVYVNSNIVLKSKIELAEIVKVLNSTLTYADLLMLKDKVADSHSLPFAEKILNIKQEFLKVNAQLNLDSKFKFTEFLNSLLFSLDFSSLIKVQDLLNKIENKSVSIDQVKLNSDLNIYSIIQENNEKITFNSDELLIESETTGLTTENPTETISIPITDLDKHCLINTNQTTKVYDLNRINMYNNYPVIECTVISIETMDNNTYEAPSSYFQQNNNILNIDKEILVKQINVFIHYQIN